MLEILSKQFSILSLFWVLLITASGSYAQNSSAKKDKYLFDNNCLPMVKKNRLVRGNPKYLNNPDKRTERWFSWDKITTRYKSLVEGEDISKAAMDRYRNYDPLNPPESLLSCKESGGDLSRCLAFNAYCTEQLSTAGMKEELIEWRDRYRNCKNPKYIANFPEHCQRDFPRSLNYLARHAKEISRIIRSKSPSVAKYFKEAQQTFSEFADELELLNIAQEDAKKNNSLRKEKDKKKEKAFKAIKSCNDLVTEDDDDIKGRDISLNILEGMSCQVSGVEVDSLKIQSYQTLALDLKKINISSSASEIAPKLNEVAIIKSAKALWSTFETFFNKDNIELSHGNFEKASELICKNTNEFDFLKSSVNTKKLCNKEFKSILKKAYSEYLDLKDKYPVKKISQSDLDYEMEHKFNPNIRELNTMCRAAKKKYDFIQAQYGCVRLKPMKFVDKEGRTIELGSEKNTPKELLRIYNDGSSMNTLKCDAITKLKNNALRKLSSESASKLKPLYESTVSSRMGHLMITDKFRDRVGATTNNWIHNKCFKGKGQDFGQVSMRDVNIGLKDFLDLNYKELHDSVIETTSDERPEEKIKEYLKNNPLTVAELLERNPSEDYAKALCSFIREINTSDYRRNLLRQGTTAVGVVAGVALSFTGIGSPAGVALLATVGTATVVEVVSLNKEIDEEKNTIKNQKQSAVTFQTNMNKAVDKVVTAQREVKSLKKSRNLTIVLGAFEAFGTGGFKLIKNFLKTRRGLIAGKIMGVSSATLSEVKASRLARDIALSMERIAKKSNSAFRKKFNSLEYEEMMELAALYSRVDDSFKVVLLKKLGKLDSVDDLRLFIHGIDGSLNQSRLLAQLDHLTTMKLADGTVIEGLKLDPAIKLNKVSPAVSDITNANMGAIKSKSFFGRRVASYTKKLDKLEDLKVMMNDIPLKLVEKDRFLSHLSFLDKANNKKLMTILSDSKKVNNDFLKQMRKSGCLSKPYTKGCNDTIQNIINKSAGRSLSEHRLAKKWLNKQSSDIQDVFKTPGLTGADLHLAKKSLDNGIKVKNLERSKEFMSYLTTLPEAKRIEGFKGLNLVLDGSKLPSKSVFKKFKNRTKIFNNYEKYFYNKVKVISPKKLKTIAKSKNIEPTKANLDKLAKEEARLLRRNFVKKFNACKAGNAKGVQKANLKRFLKFNTATSMGFTIGSYMWVMGSDDSEDLKIDSNGDLIEGTADKNYKALISVLGYELVASYVFSKIPALVLSSPGGSGLLNSAKDYAAGSGLDFINTRIFGSLFGVSESESKKKIKEMLKDPSKRAALDQLRIYVDNKMKTEKMKKITSDFQSEFSLLTKEVESDDSVDYDYLMDNFSSDELASSDELMGTFETSLNEFEYDQRAGDIPISKYVHKLTGGSTDVSVENDLFYYNLAYNVPSAVKRVFMYSLISNRLCMGRWGEVIAFTAIDKFLSNAAYWGGRKITVGDAEKLGE